MGELFLGIDGGGSSTRACIMTKEGQVLGRGAGGPSNLYYSGLDVFAKSIADAVSQSSTEAGVQMGDIAAACVALAGAGRPDDAKKARDLLKEVLSPAPFFVVEDTKAALAAAFNGEDGIIVIAGTGSNCLGIASGEYCSSGGWGALLGDEGSAYSVAVEGLRAAARSADGRLPATAMLPRFLEALGGTQPHDLIPLTHGLDRSKIASLSRIVFDAAAEGDVAARDIQSREAAQLAVMIGAVARRLGMDTPRIGLVGGCFKNPAYVQELKDKLSSTYPQAEVSPVTRAPSEGAAILARMRWEAGTLQQVPT